MKVSVSILKEKNNYKKVIDELSNSSADYIHLDIMDSTFTENSSFNLNQFQGLSSKKYDVHIMSTNLDYQIVEAIKLNPEYITFHIEATNNPMKYINLIKENNIKVGLAINPKTRIFRIRKYLSLIDLVLVMSVIPGAGGQKFIKSTIKKLRRLKRKKSTFLISVDGGINKEIVDYVKGYVDLVVSGSYITDSTNYEEKIQLLKK